MVGGEEPSICFVIAAYVFIVVFKEYFSVIFVTSNSTETILQGFRSFSVQIEGNGLAMWRNVCRDFKLPPRSRSVQISTLLPPVKQWP
jgi:hypothetical protein